MVEFRPEDFFSWPDYETVRTVTRQRMLDYIKQQRTLLFPSGMQLIFDNRHTLWFRMQETIWAGKLFPKKDILPELVIINRMLCDSGEWEAHLAPVEQVSLPPKADPWPEELSMRIGTRPELVLAPDMIKGNHLSSAWDRGLRFRWSLDPETRAAFSHIQNPVHCSLALLGQKEISEAMTLKLRRSLLGDWEPLLSGGKKG